MKTVLVTGSSSGIGKAIAETLSENGFEVVLHYNSNHKGVQELSNYLKSKEKKHRVLGFDISNRQESSKKILEDIDTNGAYYGVVCNAGLSRDNAFPALSEKDWDDVISTNLDGFFNVIQPIVMPMIRRREPGRIVTLSSVSGISGNRGQVNYSASKAGIIGATKALAVELAKRNITVNCVAPGLINTKMLDTAPVEEALKLVPMQRVGEPEEVASLIAYLMSDKAAYITRQVISVNGGMV